MDILYRYSDIVDEMNMLIVEQRFQVLKRTPCGQFVKAFFSDGPEPFGDAHVANMLRSKRVYGVRFVLDDHNGSANRRYCYRNKMHAMESYKIRKELQIQHATAAIERAKSGLDAAKTMLSVGDVFPRTKWSTRDIIVPHPHYNNGFEE